MSYLPPPPASRALPALGTWILWLLSCPSPNLALGQKAHYTEKPARGAPVGPQATGVEG